MKTDKDNDMHHQLITLTHGETMISSPDSGLILQVLTGLIGKKPANIEADSAPAIGTYWQDQGGVYAGVMRGEEGKPDYHMIVPTHASVLNHKAIYGGYELNEPGAVSRFDGLANTIALVESDTDHPAAEWCRGVVVEGHRDLYLPAILECALIAANLPDLFDKEWHVSSTQRSAYYAFGMHFVDGTQFTYGKTNEFRVRPVRRRFI